MAEYTKDNRFPFHSGDKSVSICFDDHEEKYELDFIWDKITERFPQLNAEPFYARVAEIQMLEPSLRVSLIHQVLPRVSYVFKNSTPVRQ